MSNLKEIFDTNKDMWDACVEAHAKSEFYQMERFLAGENVLDEIVKDGIGEVRGKSILHLQCHFGQDSMCLAKMGAKVTAMDFSSEAIKKAREINEQMGLDVKFIEANVYDLRDHLDEQFDIVFTSSGAICWLHDLEEWAAIVNHYLKPGGAFFMSEFHPTLYLFDFDTQKVAYDYFGDKDLKPIKETNEGSYTDGSEELVKTSYFWLHSLHETMGSLMRRGLQLVDFQEYPYSPFNCFPNMKEVAPKRYVFGDFKTSLPHFFSIRAVKS